MGLFPQPGGSRLGFRLVYAACGGSAKLNRRNRWFMEQGEIIQPMAGVLTSKPPELSTQPVAIEKATGVEDAAQRLLH